MKAGQKHRARHEGRPEKRNPAGGPGFGDEARRTGETPQRQFTAILPAVHLPALLSAAPTGLRVVAVFDAAGRIADLCLLVRPGRDPVAVPTEAALRAAVKSTSGADLDKARRHLALFLAQRTGLGGSA